MRGTLAAFVKPCLALALLVGGPGSAENEVMPTLVSPSCCALMPLKARSRTSSCEPSQSLQGRPNPWTPALAMCRSIGVPQMMQKNQMMPQMMPQMMQSSWTPTVAMQTATSIGIPQMMQNNEMMPQVMQNLKQSPMMPQIMHAMQNQMEMILRRRSS